MTENTGRPQGAALTQRNGWQSHFTLLQAIDLRSDSIPAAAAQHGLQDILKIAVQAHAFYHFRIGLRKFFWRGHVDFLHLGKTGDAGPDSKNTENGTGGNQFVLIGQAGTRPDKAHFTFEDIPELRQFVQLGSAQKSAKRGDS